MIARSVQQKHTRHKISRNMLLIVQIEPALKLTRRPKSVSGMPKPVILLTRSMTPTGRNALVINALDVALRHQLPN